MMTHEITWYRTGRKQFVEIVKQEGGYYFYKMQNIDVIYKVRRREWDTIRPLDAEPVENLPLLKGMI